MDITTLLFLNILLVAFFIAISIWGTGYVMRWWLRTQRANFAINEWYKKMTCLEIKLPREIHKSPAAMEVLLNTLIQPSGHNDYKYYKPREVKDGKKEKAYKWKEGNRKRFYDTYLKGKLRLWHSLEIVSEEGQIRFFLVTAQKYTDVFKSYAYSQFPGIEINEVEDYTHKYHYEDNKTGSTQIYATRWKLGSDDYLPIKTYVDYGLDDDPKEEYKIDPITPLLETFASAGPGETFVYQILIRPTIFEKEWKEETYKRMDKLLGLKREEKDGKYDHKAKVIGQDREVSKLFPHEKDELEILQKNLEKPGFDVSIRSYYIAHDKSKFSVSRGMLGVLNSMKGFGKPGFNSFVPDTITPGDDYPFLDPKGLRTESNRQYIWFQFKTRSAFYYEVDGGALEWRKFFYKWWVAKSWDWALGHIGDMKEYLSPGHHRGKGDVWDFILNSEELATIWHFPGSTFGNTSARVDSVKADPPRNLPI